MNKHEIIVHPESVSNGSEPIPAADQSAMDMANEAVKGWNRQMRQQVSAAAIAVIQSEKMATDIITAIDAYMASVPPAVRAIVNKRLRDRLTG